MTHEVEEIHNNGTLASLNTFGRGESEVNHVREGAPLLWHGMGRCTTKEVWRV